MCSVLIKPPEKCSEGKVSGEGGSQGGCVSFKAVSTHSEQEAHFCVPSMCYPLNAVPTVLRVGTLTWRN